MVFGEESIGVDGLKYEVFKRIDLGVEFGEVVKGNDQVI